MTVAFSQGPGDQEKEADSWPWRYQRDWHEASVGGLTRL